MIKITSSYHKKLHCQVGEKSIGIEPNQVITVDDETGRALLENSWIHEVKEGAKTPIFGAYDVPFGTKKPSKKKIEKPIKKKKSYLREIKQ